MNQFSQRGSLMDKVSLSDSGCWIWKAGKIPDGYGTVKWQKKDLLAHRVFAHMFLGFDLESSLHVLHKCDVPACVNPKHLFIGTNADNMRDRDAKRRQWQMKKTHCHKGHPFDVENTHVFGEGKWRYCRTCKREANRKTRERLQFI